MFIKMFYATMILSLAPLTFTQLHASAAKPESQPVTVRGILERNAQGTMECEITYNKEAGTYKGNIYNKGFCMAAWYSRPLEPQEAQTYYNQLQAAQVKAASDAKAKK